MRRKCSTLIPRARFMQINADHHIRWKNTRDRIVVTERGITRSELLKHVRNKDYVIQKYLRSQSRSRSGSSCSSGSRSRSRSSRRSSSGSRSRSRSRSSSRSVSRSPGRRRRPKYQVFCNHGYSSNGTTLLVKSKKRGKRLRTTKIPAPICHGIRSHCRYRNPVTKRYAKYPNDGSEDKNYRISLMY